MKRVVDIYITCILLTFFLFFGACTDIKLPAIFSDNMILQQQSQVAVWGWVKPNTTVRVAGSWDDKTYSVISDAKGYWRVRIATPAAGFTPYTLTINGRKTVTLSNILIGEVWICSGQSNMEMPMKGFPKAPVEGGHEAIASSSNPYLRCFTVAKASKSVPQGNCTGVWKMANPQTTPEFTATGYFFGRLLNQTLDVPVGLIHASWSGSRIEAWMTPNSLKDIPEKPIPVSDDDIKIQNWTPTVLYNGMIHPVLGFGIRGAIWYQGEQNRDEPALYIKMFDAMVREWRDLWDMGEFPFYYCQIAPYNYDDDINSAYIREAQAKGMTTTSNTGMAVLMDTESVNSLHPPKKRDAGERMALWALSRTYGMDKIHYRSPEMKSFEIEDHIAVVTFDIAADPGLTTYGKEIQNFIIAGSDKRFYPAKADYSGNKIYLFSPAVAEPVAVRYCWDNISVTELFSVEGELPVSSFRTDDW